MRAPHVEIRGVGNSYTVEHDGRVLGRANSYDNACVRARAWENRLQQEDRHCVCCGQTFTANGHFIRLCDGCKQALA